MSYILEYKESAASSWITGVGGSQASDYFTGSSTIVTSLTNGTSYDFRVSALNIHGQGSYTDPVIVATTDDIPGTPNAPTTTNNGLTVTIDWEAPAANGSPIQNYTVTVLNGLGA